MFLNISSKPVPNALNPPDGAFVFGNATLSTRKSCTFISTAPKKALFSHSQKKTQSCVKEDILFNISAISG
jgi:hypothetical protein